MKSGLYNEIAEKMRKEEEKYLIFRPEFNHKAQDEKIWKKYEAFCKHDKKVFELNNDLI